MKKLIRIFAVDLVALICTSQIAQGMVFDQGIRTILLTTGALSLVSIFIKPVINILLLPINLVTFGLFKWLSSSVALYLVTLIIKGFHINYFTFGGFSSPYFDLPAIYLQKFLAFIAFSFIISLINSIINWFFK